VGDLEGFIVGEREGMLEPRMVGLRLGGLVDLGITAMDGGEVEMGTLLASVGKALGAVKAAL